MATSASPAQPYRFFIVLGSLVLVTAALYWAQKVLIPVALAILLTFLLSPAVTALQRRGLGRIPSVLLVVLLAFSLLGGIGTALALQVRSLADEIPQYKDNILTKVAGLRGDGKGSFLDRFKDLGRDISEALKGDPLAAGIEPDPVPVQVQDSGFAQVQAALGPAVEVLATAGLVVVLVLFMLIQREDLRNRLVRLLGHGQVLSTTRMIDEAARRISRYLLMQLLINVGFGVLLGLGLFVIGVPYALLWAFLATVLRFIPYVGTWLLAILLIVFSVAVLPGWIRPLEVVALFIVLELFAYQVAEPLLFGHSTGISPVALLVAAAFWTWLWGPIGLVLATPLTACLVVLGKYVPPLEFFGVLLGDEPVLSPAVRYYQRLLAHDQDEATDLVEAYLQEHPKESVFNEVLVPALLFARRDRELGQLSAADEQFILRATRANLEYLPSVKDDPACRADDNLPADSANRPRALLLGCPAGDEEDELALLMLAQTLEPVCRAEVLSSRLLPAEVLQKVEELRPAVVCIAALPPGGLAQSRYLCKRLRAQHPHLKIAVGRWGQEEDLDRMRERLRTAGADLVGTTLRETRCQVIPLLQAAAPAPMPGPQAEGFEILATAGARV